MHLFDSEPTETRHFNKDQEPLLEDRVNIILILGCVFVPLFGWLDYILYPDLFTRFMTYRLFASLCCIVLLVINRSGNRPSRSVYLGIAAFYIVGLIIVKMILDTGGYATSYYAGLNLVFLGFCTVLPLHPKILIFHCLVLYVTYVLSVLIAQPPGHISHFLGNNLFVLSTLVIALLVSLVNHRLRFKEYTLRQELEAAHQKLRAYSKSLESTVEESEEKYRLVVEYASDAIFILQDRVITFPNPKTLALLGYTAEELLGISPIRLLAPEDRSWVSDTYRRMREGEDLPPMEPFRILNKRGEVLWIDVSSVPITWKGRKAFLQFARDITERKKLEVELFQAQKMEAVGTLAGGIAHDFNNLLQVISGYLQLILMGKSPDDPDYYSLTQIDKSAQRAADLTRRLLLYGRKVESQLTPIDLNQLILRVSSLLERVIPKMIFMEMRLTANLKRINGDPTQIEQILMNLVVNARDAMKDGGRITIETKNFVMDTEFCQKHADAVPGEYVHLSISDTGHGMSQKVQERIFDPFYTTKEKGKGTGLGLAIVYSIVKSHRGTITCQSGPEKGTVFEIYLPVVRDGTIRPGMTEKEEGALQGSGETILFVDDDRDLLQLSQDMLETYNYRMLSAETGEEALVTYERNKDLIALVILDLNMPGMGGAKCLEKLLEINPRLRVIIATGYLEEGQMDDLLKAGASAYVAKPYKFQTMLKEIRELVKRDS